MADASVAGSAVVNGRLLLKRRGNWTLYAYDLAGDAPPSGQVACEWLGTQLLGHVLRSGLADGAVDAVITGGRTEHSKRLSAAMYDYQVPVALVLQGILSEQGEQGSATIDPALLRRTLARYNKVAGTLGQQLDQLADALGVVWRILLDGSVWLGVDTYATAGPFEHVLSAEWRPGSSRLLIEPDAIGLLPGQSYSGPQGYTGAAFAVRVSDIAYCIGPEKTTATAYALDARADGESGISGALRAVVREETAHMRYSKPHAGKVLLQRPDGTLDVRLDDPDFAPLTSVQVRVPVAGAKLTVPDGARCIVEFEDGNHNLAVVTSYAVGNAQHAVALKGGRVDVGTIQFIAVANGVLTGTYIPPTGMGSPRPFVLGDVISLVGKIADGSPDISLPSAPT